MKLILGSVLGGIATTMFAAPVTVAGASFAVPWVVEPGTVSGQRKIVRPSESLIEARLLPARLFVIDRDAVDERGKVVISKGAELAYGRSPMMMACVINPKKAKQRAKINLTANTRNTCLVDTDGDGAYDYQSLYASRYYALGANGELELFSKITRTPYREVDVALSQDSPTLQLRYRGVSGKTLRLELCPQQQAVKYEACLAGDVSRRIEDFPAEVQVAGAVVTVHGRVDKGLEVSIGKAFDAKEYVIGAKWF